VKQPNLSVEHNFPRPPVNEHFFIRVILWLEKKIRGKGRSSYSYPLNIIRLIKQQVNILSHSNC
jgi:hypothetical protein